MRPFLSHLTSANGALTRHFRLKGIAAQGSTRLPAAARSRARMTWGRSGNARTLASTGALATIAAAALLAAAASAGSTAPLGGPAADCQPFLDDRPCLQPFPSDLYTKKANTPTGRRVSLPANAMPVNTQGVAINPAKWNRSDGFSPGSMITVHVPGLDTPQAIQNTNPVPLTDIAQYRRRGAPVVVIDQDTGERHPIWAELDSNAASPQATNLLIHPAVNFEERHRYVVALRDLEDANGNSIRAPRWFELLRDGGNLPAELKDQRKPYQDIFKALRRAGIERGENLYEAWNFTVASRKSLASRLLHIRDDAFAQLGDRDLADREVEGAAPEFQVTGVRNFTPEENDRLLRIVTGTFSVPCYLDQQGCPPGAGFTYNSADPDALPTQIPGNTATADFICIIPRIATGAPARASLYGTGAPGNAEGVGADAVQDMASEHDMVFCATDTWFLSDGDVPYAISVLQDLTKGPALIDRLQQSALNTQFLGRLMIHPQGLATDPAFQSNGAPLIDTGRLYYDGDSQGGMTGGMNTAIAPDFSRAVLGVPFMNFGGMFLQRSIVARPMLAFLYAQVPGGGYADDSLHPLILNLISQLFDRAEANGYAQHVTSDPLPGTPKHKVLMQVAYGDFSATQYGSAVEARTIGARSYQPALDLPARQQDANLLYMIPGIKRFPFNGSAIVIWDSGPEHNTPPPLTNTPPQEGVNGTTPHLDVRATVAARQQKSDFLQPHGRVTDVCGGAPCHTDAFAP
jgi:hypothetical protein